MPIYEYECQQCGRRFETLVRGTTKPECPSCQGTDLTRVLSVFAVGAKDTASPSANPCGSCSHSRGPGLCSMN